MSELKLRPPVPPFMRWLGSVDILGRVRLKKEKQIPHPAKNAEIRDDKFPEAGVRNSMSTIPDGF